MTDKQIDLILNRLDEIDPSLADNFSKAKEKDNWLKEHENELEGNSDYVRKYKNLADFKGDRVEKLNKLWTEHRGKGISFARMDEFIDSNPDIYGKDPDYESAYKDILGYFEKSDQYYDQFKKSQEEDANRVKRQQEVEGKLIGDEYGKNWGPIKKFVTSEYEKQRYINDPEAALFGYEAPSLGKAKATRWGSAGDLAAGALAGAADIAPLKATGVGGVLSTVLGPGIRAARDAAHKASGSPYQKNWSDIGKDVVTDLASNATANYLLNYRKAGRMLGEATDVSPNLSRGIQLEKDIGNTLAGIEQIKKAEKNGRAMRIAVLNMPDSPLKKELLPLVEDVKNVDFDKIGSITERYAIDSEPFMRDIRSFSEGVDYPVDLPEPTNLAKQALDVTPYTKAEKKELAKMKLRDRLTRGVVGRSMVNLQSDINDGTRPNLIESALTNKPEYKFNEVDPNDEIIIRMWKNKFVPGKSDPLYDDYLEWKKREEEKNK